MRTPLGVENPKGEWNEIEIRVQGSKQATFILNGEVVLETFDFNCRNEAGEKTPLDRGHIGLQAEWAELLFRNIRIKDLSPPQDEAEAAPESEPGSGTSSGSDSK